jgi:hypothetical protein
VTTARRRRLGYGRCHARGCAAPSR